MLGDRIILICGKGGVGRTVISAALAKALAAKKHAVLLCDLGAPEGGHSPLARLFGCDNFSDTPQKLTAFIDSVHLCPAVGHRQFLTDTVIGGAFLGMILKSAPLQALMETAPSFAEMGIFYQLLTLIKEKQNDGSPKYQHIIIDMPATGHAQALTDLPTILKKIIHYGPVAKALDEGQSYLNNPQFCHAWVLSLPEQLPLSEAFDLITGLEQSKVPVGGVILNRQPACNLSPIQFERALNAQEGRQFLGSGELLRRKRALEARQRLIDLPADLEVIDIPDFNEYEGDLLFNVTSCINEVLS